MILAYQLVDMTQTELKQVINYDSQTGYFFCAKTGQRIDSPHTLGYRTIHFNKKTYFAHRLAWLYVYGNNPISEIDHINKIRSDNRISNLREATKSENKVNGNKGRGYSPNGKGWKASIKVKQQQIHLGTFATQIEASDAYEKARIHYFGNFSS